MVALVVLMLISLCVGAVKIPPADLWAMLSGNEGIEGNGKILMLVRLPRVLAAVLAGAALACSGTILQTVLSNPMCSPNIIGVNAGAGLFMIVIAAFFPAAVGLAPVSAFIGALVAVLVVYGVARKTGASKLMIVLSGIAVSGLLSALTDGIITLVPDAKVSRIDFLIGSFSGVAMNHVLFALPYILTGIIIAIFLSTDLNLLALGDGTASSLGQRVGIMRGIFLVIAALLAGSAISLAGLIGFVGLIVPHIAKAIVGYDHKYLIPLTVILGGGFCLLCDTLARMLFIPFELPVGIVMSLLGSPFFIWLIWRQRRRKVFD